MEISWKIIISKKSKHIDLNCNMRVQLRNKELRTCREEISTPRKYSVTKIYVENFFIKEIFVIINYGTWCGYKLSEPIYCILGHFQCKTIFFQKNRRKKKIK